jgi:hypothetical protein
MDGFPSDGVYDNDHLGTFDAARGAVHPITVILTVIPSFSTQSVQSGRSQFGNRRRPRAPRHDPFHGQTTDQAKPLVVNPFFTWIGTA